MRTIGNFLWFIFGGGVMGITWWLVGIVSFLSIVGIPYGKSCFVMGQFSFFPFGKEAVNREELTGVKDIGTGNIGFLSNLIWFLFAGIWLAFGHIIAASVSFISIIGIPFGVQHLKLAGISLAPVGKTIVSKEVAAEARKANARWLGG